MTTYYATATGGTGAGSIGDPWSLTHALSGAGGTLVGGDIVLVDDLTGDYKAVAGFTASCSGTAGHPIVFRKRLGTTPVINGAYQSLTWEVVDAGLKTWRTVGATFSGNQYGHVRVGGKWYPLACFESQTSLTSTSQYYSSTAVFYPGPGVYAGVVSGHIVTRLEAVADGINGARPFTPLGSTDPTALTMTLCGATQGITVTGDYLTFDGLTINDYEALFYSPTAAATIGITVTNCTGRWGYFMARLENFTNWTFTGNTFDGNLYHDDWWVWGSDVKGTLTVCDNNRKCIWDLSGGNGLTITDNQFSNAYDGIIDSGSVVHNVVMTGNTFYNIWDDAWQLTMRIYETEIAHNFFYGAAISHDATGTGTANLSPATIYYHHNVIDTTTQYFPDIRAASAGVTAVIDECIPISIHGSPSGYSGPWKIYYNTFVFNTPRSGGFLNLGLFGAELSASHYDGFPHEVMNNLLVCLSAGGRAWDKNFYANSGHEIYDGNACSGWIYPHGIYRFIITSTGTLDQTNPPTTPKLATFAGMRTTQALADSQAYYAPGWEASGVMVDDALIDGDYDPQNALVRIGAVNLTSKGWPGTTTYQAARGAVGEQTPGLPSRTLNAATRSRRRALTA